jgi:hypothetical protein
VGVELEERQLHVLALFAGLLHQFLCDKVEVAVIVQTFDDVDYFACLKLDLVDFAQKTDAVASSLERQLLFEDVFLCWDQLERRDFSVSVPIFAFGVAS